MGFCFFSNKIQLVAVWGQLLSVARPSRLLQVLVNTHFIPGARNLYRVLQEPRAEGW